MKSLHTLKPLKPFISEDFRKVVAYLRRPANSYAGEVLWFKVINGDLWFKWSADAPLLTDGDWHILSPTYIAEYLRQFGINQQPFADQAILYVGESLME